MDCPITSYALQMNNLNKVNIFMGLFMTGNDVKQSTLTYDKTKVILQFPPHSTGDEAIKDEVRAILSTALKEQVSS